MRVADSPSCLRDQPLVLERSIMTLGGRARAPSRGSLQRRVSIKRYCPLTMVSPPRHQRFVMKLNSVTLTVTNAIIHHCSLAPGPSPITIPVPIPFVGRSLTLQVPFVKLPPNDTVFLPSFPYRPGYWLLDTPLRGVTERMGRKKYGLE